MGNYVRPPKEERISARVSSATKRKLRNLPYSYGEVLEIGAEYLSNETHKLSWEKGELERELSALNKKVAEKEAKIVAINNRLRVINPNVLDGDTLNDLIDFATADHAMGVYKEHGEKSLKRVKLKKVSMAIHRFAREKGYDPNSYYDSLVSQLEKLCHTDVSDNLSEVVSDDV